MIVECSRCGAPLNVTDGKRFTQCAYCGASSETRALKTVSTETPLGWRPPPRWQPPPHIARGPNADLPYHPPGRAGAGVAIAIGLAGALAVAGGVFALVLTSGGRSKGSGALPSLSLSGVDPARLSAVTLRERREDLVKLLGGDSRDKTLRVPLAGEWSAVTFEWDPAHPEHVLQFYLNCDSSRGVSPAARARLEGLLPKRWDGDSFRWEGVSMYYAPKSGVLSVRVSPEREASRTNPFWKQQSEAMWSVVRAGALGLPTPVDAAAVREHLGGGYPITSISLVPFDVAVDGSAAAVAKVFPGVSGEKRIDLDYTIPLSHPWLEQGEISWGNAKGAKMKRVELRRSGGKQLDHQDEIAKCVEVGFGLKPEVNESDYLAKKRDYTYNLKGGGEIRVYEHLIKLELRDYPFTPPMPKANLDKALAVLDACGRK